jgi:hypothetical protein
MKNSANDNARQESDGGDIEPVSGQPIDEAEKNLSRHATKDSSPPVGEEWRASVTADETTEER